MTAILKKKPFLHTDWADNVRLRIADGPIESIEIGCPVNPNDLAAGVVVPRIANAHGHAFQLALAGHAEERGLTGI